MLAAWLAAFAPERSDENAWRTHFGISFGGYKQSGIGREGSIKGLLPFLETKLVVLEGRPADLMATD